MIDIKEASRITGVPVRTFRNWCQTGVLKPSVKMGGGWIIKLSEEGLKKAVDILCRKWQDKDSKEKGDNPI